ncbi:MAG: TetR/AcrR family transcriptional regulator [Eubacteriales bacterium]|nr:TetR/AcrR family transcriptional regulator [Eubacteriales bacterium]
MRKKDDNKKEAIIEATVQLSNELGFSNLSMSKIAKRADVSAATLYVYYENKEDMFRKVYMDIKKKMILGCSQGIRQEESVEQSVRKICGNLLRYIQEHTEEFLFIEQACNSPLATDEMIAEIEQQSKVTNAVFERGIQEGILKQTSPTLLIGFCFYPIQQIFKECQKEKSMLRDVDFDLVFQMCWDAIRR